MITLSKKNIFQNKLLATTVVAIANTSWENIIFHVFSSDSNMPLLETLNSISNNPFQEKKLFLKILMKILQNY